MQQNWDNSNLGRYLRLNQWNPHIAFRILAGLDYYGPGDDPWDEFDPDFSLDRSVGIYGQLSFTSQEDSERNYSQLKEMWVQYDRLSELWSMGLNDFDEKHPPAFFIAWAISQEFQPEWLHWAIEKNLYTPSQINDHRHVDSNNTTKPMSRQQFQQQEILRVIRELKHDPQKLPKAPPGKSGIKSEVKAMLTDPMWQGTVFNKAWDRLRSSGEIQDA